MTFGSPLLLASLAVPLVALLAYLWIERKPPRAAISFPNLAVLAGVARRSSWKRHLIAALLLMTLVLLCVAVARPRVALASPADRATVVLVVDVSVSMNAVDVKPSRLEAAKLAIASFVDRVPCAGQDRPRRLLRRSCRARISRPPIGRSSGTRSRLCHPDTGRRSAMPLPGASTSYGSRPARQARRAVQRPRQEQSSFFPTAPRREGSWSLSREPISRGRRESRSTRLRWGRRRER